jgi:hypothetical protein
MPWPYDLLPVAKDAIAKNDEMIALFIYSLRFNF